MSEGFGPIINTPGHGGVDFETRVDFDRLRAYRLARAREALEASEFGAILLFDFYNIRYVSQTWIGGALGDKMSRYCLLTRHGEPMVWDFGSAARHHRLFAPWLEPDNCRAGMLGLRGAIAPRAGLFESAVKEIVGILKDAGVADQPVGIDITELPFLFEMQKAGIDVRDAQQLMLDARQIKNPDELMLLSQAAAMVDGVYQDIFEALKPGIRENEIVALANKRLYEMGSDQVEAINAVSGERCNPHPHNFTDRIIRPGEQAFFDIIHSYNGYRTCYHRAPTRRLREGALLDGYGHRSRATGRRDRRDRPRVASGDGVWLRERDGRLRPAVRPRTGPRASRTSRDQPAEQHARPDRAASWHGFRARDVLSGDRRHVGSPH
jgi:Xaa-Pro dipeptidase